MCNLPQPESISAVLFESVLKRQANARKLGLSEATAEFAWMQQLGLEGTQQVCSEIRNATKVATKFASEVVLGIKAESAEQGISTLKAWVQGLDLQKGVLYAYDETGAEVSVSSFTEQDSRSVYIKFNSTKNGDAYMKEFRPTNNGVIFQVLINGSFHQHGDFPLFAFRNI